MFWRKNNNLEQIIIKIILLLGVLLSLVQFFYNRSLWLDEASLAINIINRSSLELLKPLDYIQVAPILFLQIEKIFSELVPNIEYGLRLFPLLSFLLSIFFFFKIIKIIHLHYYTIIFSLSLFVFNATLIYYSSEVKQYMIDVLVVTSIYYFMLKKYQTERTKYYLLSFIGTISIFLSNITPVILFSTGVYLLFDIYHNKKNQLLLYLIVCSFIWISAFMLLYFMFIYNHPALNAQIFSFSRSGYNVFMPINPFNINFYLFFFHKGSMIVNSLFAFGIIGGIILSFLILMGIVNLIRQKRIDLIILTILPLILHLLLSSFKLYPFDKRFILYIIPAIIIICSFGFNYFANILFANLKINKFTILSTIIPVVLIFYLCVKGYPLQNEEIKKSIHFIQQHLNKNDKIYIYYGASRAFEYYNNIHFINISAPVIIGKGRRKNNAKYMNEIKKLKGKNWLLFSHVWSDEETYIVKQLDLLNYNKINEFKAQGSSTYLYDFGE